MSDDKNPKIITDVNSFELLTVITIKSLKEDIHNLKRSLKQTELTLSHILAKLEGDE